MTAPQVRIRPVEDDDLPIFLAHQDDPIAAAMAAFPTRAPDVFFEHWAKIRADPINYHPRRSWRTARSSATSSAGSTTADARSATGSAATTGGRGTRRRPSDSCSTRSRTGRSRRTSPLDNIGSQRVVEHCGFVRVGEEVADDGVHEVIFRLD